MCTRGLCASRPIITTVIPGQNRSIPCTFAFIFLHLFLVIYLISISLLRARIKRGFAPMPHQGAPPPGPLGLISFSKKREI